MRKLMQQDPNNPTTPTEQSPAPQPTPVAPPPVALQSPPDYSNVMVGGQVPTTPPQKSYKKLIILIIAVLVGLGVFGIFFVIVKNMLTPSASTAPATFKAITYSNGQGATYNLQFYSDYSLRPMANSVPAGFSKGISPQSKQLVAKTSVNGKLPLTMWIATGNAAASALYRTNDCASGGLTKTFTVHVDFIDTDVSVCGIKQQGQGVDLIYLVTLHQAKKGYLVYFAQDVDFAKTLSDPAAAAATLTRVGLEDYQHDITTILASLKPID